MVGDSTNRGVRIRVTADTAKARADIAKLNGSFQGVQKSATNAADSIKRLALGVGTLFTGGALTHGINKATDSLIEMENQVALVVGRGKELNEQMDALYQIAKDTKAPISSTAESFSRMGRAMRDAGASTEDINKAVITLNKAATISGGAVESQRAALFQLSQGIASGTLRGEELNSVMEQLPRVATLIKDELQIGTKELRKMAEQGEITSEVVFGALLNQSKAVSAEFGVIELTSSKAFLLLGDQVKRLVADLSKATGFTDSFVQKIQAATEFIAGNRESFVESVVEAQREFRSFMDTVREMSNRDDLIDFAKKLFGSVRDLAQSYLAPTESFIRDWANRISKYFFNIYDEVIGHSWWTDTMEETQSLAEKHLGNTLNVLSDFKDKAINTFRELYGNSKGKFKINFEMAVGALVNLKDKISDTIQKAVTYAFYTLTSIEGPLRKQIVNALMAGFVLVFSSGSLKKVLTKFADKIGPLMWAGLAAKFIEEFANPKVSAQFGFMAGQFVGAIVQQIISALPEILTNMFISAGAALIGVFNTSGLDGLLATLIAIGWVFSKKFREMLISAIGNVFKGVMLPAQGKGNGIFKRFDIEAEITSRKLKGLDAAALRVGHGLRTTVKNSAMEAAKGFKEMNREAGYTARTMNTNLGSSFIQTERRARGMRTAVIAGIAALALFATQASASTGEEGGGGGWGLADIGMIAAGSLVASTTMDLFEGAAGKLADAFMGSFAGRFLVGAGTMLASIGTAIMGAFVAFITSPITIAVSAIAATGGILYVMFFGEGNSFMEKLKDVINDIKAQFGVLNLSTFEAAKKFRKQAEQMTKLGEFHDGGLANRNIGKRLQDLNFVSIDDANARELTTAMDNLQALQSKAASEQSVFNKVSEETRQKILAAQNRVADALEAAEGNQAKTGQPIIDYFEKLKNKAAPFGAGAIDALSLDIGNGAARQDIQSILDNNDMSTMEDIDAAFRSLGMMGVETLTNTLGEGAAKMIDEISRGPEMDRETFDAISNLIHALESDNEKEIERARADYNAALADAPSRESRRNTEALWSVFRERNPDASLTDLAKIDRGSLNNISQLQANIGAQEGMLQRDLLNNDFDVAENLKRAEYIETLKVELERAIQTAFQSGIEGTNFNIVKEKLNGAGISETLASEIASAFDNNPEGLTGAFGRIGREAVQLDEIEKQIEDITKKTQIWDDATREQLVSLQQQKAELQQSINLAAQIADTKRVEPDEISSLVAEAATLSGLDIDFDKLFKINPKLKEEIAGLTAEVLAFKLVANSGNEDALAETGAESFDALLKTIEDRTKAITGKLKGVGKGILNKGTAEISDWERLLQGTGLSIENAAKLGSKEASSIVKSLKAIEASEKAINKLAIGNTAERNKQLAAIKAQRDAIQGTLLSGTVGQAQDMLGQLGLDPELLSAGQVGIDAGLKLLELTRERSMLDANDTINYKLKTEEMIKQEELIGRIVDKTNTLKDATEEGLRSSITEYLKTGDLESAFHGLMDTVTSSIIDSFVDGLVSAIMKSKFMTGMFDKLFSGETFKALGTLLGGGGGGGAAAGASTGGFWSSIGKFLGFDQGGEVPMTPFAQHGKDSVPAMLKPGERILSKNDLRNGTRGGRGNGQNTTVNLNVTGDISKQTRKEILGMIPQITHGVNTTNKEANYKYR